MQKIKITGNSSLKLLLTDRLLHEKEAWGFEKVQETETNAFIVAQLF